MDIAFFSPLPPLRSGISDYSHELLMSLINYTQIDLYVDNNYQVSDHIARNFPIYKISDFDKISKKKVYDGLIYHIGNNEKYHGNIYKIALENPGIVVLHDFSIHHMIAELTYAKGLEDKYIEEMYYNHGEIGRKKAISFLNGQTNSPWNSNAMEFPLNKRLIESARGIIVHSYFARQNIKKVKKAVPVKVINMHCQFIVENEEEEKLESRKRLGINFDIFVLASFGFINSNRRIDKVLNALRKVKETSDKHFKYFLVGEQNDTEYSLKELIINLDLQDVVELIGFVELDNYIDYMKAADICINLRYPTYGETSANLHRMLGMGKVVLVTNAGTFSEYPDDTVIKVDILNEEEDIFNILAKLTFNNELRLTFSKNALDYAREHCHIDNSTREYIKFILSIKNGQYSAESFIEDVAQCLGEICTIDNGNSFLGNVCEEVAALIY